MNNDNLHSFAQSFMVTPLMPLLFVGHGNPMNAIENNRFSQGIKSQLSFLPKPQAILCISAHWYTKGSRVTAMHQPQTIHDFKGFPLRLSQFSYHAAGSPELAKIIKELLIPYDVELDQEWGLDHGTWSVLTHLFPKADIPVVQLSIDYTKSAKIHFALAHQLQILRQHGVLIVGSGNIIHNLRLVDFEQLNTNNYGFDWAIDASTQLRTWIETENNEALIGAVDSQNHALKLAIPTPEHYLPLLYIMSLKQQQETIHFFNDELVAGSLSMTSLLIQ